MQLQHNVGAAFCQGISLDQKRYDISLTERGRKKNPIPLIIYDVTDWPQSQCLLILFLFRIRFSCNYTSIPLQFYNERFRFFCLSSQYTWKWSWNEIANIYAFTFIPLSNMDRQRFITITNIGYAKGKGEASAFWSKEIYKFLIL